MTNDPFDTDSFFDTAPKKESVSQRPQAERPGSTGRRTVRLPFQPPLAPKALAATVVLLVVAALVGGYFLLKPSSSGSGQDQPVDPAALTGLDFTSSGVLGDLDGDGELSQAEQADLAQTKAGVATLSKAVFAAKGVSTSLVTPAGLHWWQLINSFAATIDLASIAPPEDVTWYAVTSGRAYRPLDGHTRVYEALHLKFADDLSAQTWVRVTSSEGFGNKVQFAYRGDGVVTITPAWVDPEIEPLRAVASLKDVTIKEGYWSIDFRDQVAAEAATAANPPAYQRMWRYTGLANATWTATSPYAEAPWVGTVDGFDERAVDGTQVAVSVNRFYSEGCDRGATKEQCLQSEDTQAAIREMYASDAQDRAGGNPVWLQPFAVPADADIFLGRSASFFGNATGAMARYAPQVPVIGLWVTGGDTLTIQGAFKNRDTYVDAQ